MKNMKKAVAGLISAIAVFSLVSVASAAPTGTIAQIHLATKAPTIDGQVDDVWEKATAYKLNNFPSPTNGENFVKPTSDDGLSATWRALWDADNLYFLAEVTDKKKTVNKDRVNQGDSVELYIDPTNSKEAAKGAKNSGLQFGYKYDRLEGWIGSNFAKYNKAIIFKQTETVEGYIIEASIPWTAIYGENIAVGKQIGIDVMVNNSDDGKTRHSKLSWHTKSDDAWENVSLLGTANLSDSVDVGNTSAGNSGDVGNTSAGNSGDVGDSAAVTNTGTLSAIPTSSNVLVNGQKVAFEAYNINGSNYFKLRDIAMILKGTEKQIEVGFDQTKNAIALTSGKAYTAVGGELVVSASPTKKDAKLTTSKIYLDDKEIALTAYNIDGSNYFKLRDVGKAINFGITFDVTTSTIGVDTSKVYTE